MAWGGCPKPRAGLGEVNRGQGSDLLPLVVFGSWTAEEYAAPVPLIPTVPGLPTLMPVRIPRRKHGGTGHRRAARRHQLRRAVQSVGAPGGVFHARCCVAAAVGHDDRDQYAGRMSGSTTGTRSSSSRCSARRCCWKSAPSPSRFRPFPGWRRIIRTRSERPTAWCLPSSPGDPRGRDTRYGRCTEAPPIRWDARGHPTGFDESTPERSLPRLVRLAPGLNPRVSAARSPRDGAGPAP